MRRPAAVLALVLLGAPSRAAVRASVKDAAGRPVADAVVFVYAKTGQDPPPPAEPFIMDQIDKEFVPRVLAVPAGAKVRFPNKDGIHHHIYSFSEAKAFELPLYKGEPAEPVVFDKPGIVKLGCNIHDWMFGVILVAPTPHFAATGADGAAVVETPAAASVSLAVFHERLKGSVDATVQKVPLSAGGGSAAWTIDLKPARKKAPRPIGY